mmetsp:Transcript_132987/g.384596  ORF Transcript_132987/g.384596 Transcript_132987/m.384596 type:complete len:137 (-) Transcript_132987:119-529(-)
MCSSMLGSAISMAMSGGNPKSDRPTLGNSKCCLCSRVSAGQSVAFGSSKCLLEPPTERANHGAVCPVCPGSSLAAVLGNGEANATPDGAMLKSKSGVAARLGAAVEQVDGVTRCDGLRHFSGGDDGGDRKERLNES